MTETMTLSPASDSFNELSVEGCTIRLADDFLWFESGIFQHSLGLTAAERASVALFLKETAHKLKMTGGQEFHTKLSEQLEIYAADCDLDEDHFNFFLDHHDARFIVAMKISDLPKLIAFFVRGAKEALWTT